LPPAAKSTADLFFAVAIHGGCVNQINPKFEGCPEHTIEDFVGYIRESDTCATKSKGTDLQSSRAKRPEFHGK
jgi:hypothetical protein